MLVSQPMGPRVQHSRSSLQTFVIRIWLERQSTHEEPAILRGSIVHALSSEKRNITDLQQAVSFIETYLQSEPSAENLDQHHCP